MNLKLSLAAVLAALLLASLACQTGQILSPEEATQAAIETREAEFESSSEAISSDIDPGSTVELSGLSYLVAIVDEPGSDNTITNVSRGDTATVLEAAQFEGEIWYRVDTDGGDGWIKGDFVRPAAGSEEAGAPLFREGDQPYLTGTQFLISMMRAPGTNDMIAGQERGVQVTVLEARRVEEDVWYLIDAPTGEGWVPEGNLSSEAPGS